MLYRMYQFQDDLIAPVRAFAKSTRLTGWPGLNAWNPAVPHTDAWLEMLARLRLTHESLGFNIPSVMVGNREVEVREEVTLDLPFGELRHFAKDVDIPQPRVLVVAPLSGHFATLLRGTIEVLLRDHDVYVTDWKNARDVPLSQGAFGVEDYVDYLIRFME
ncbi:unnamed protein product, partial [Ectocarpus sp. 12 AP-2014]